MKRIFCFHFFVRIGLVVLTSLTVSAQSNRPISSNPTPTPDANIKISESLEKTTLVVSSGFATFLKDLNTYGRLGYRVLKSLNYGGSGNSQSFAAVLILEPDNQFEYDWVSSPNKNFLQTRLNSKARTGFTFINSFALTSCGDSDTEADSNPSMINSDILKLNKGDVFLVQRKNGVLAQTKEYKVLVAKLGLGKTPSKDLQKALDELPNGLRPTKVLFSKSGFADFAISILLEQDVSESELTKSEFRFIKEVGGFEKEINSLAAIGFRIISGRRIGLVKMALMVKENSNPTFYSLMDEEKYTKEFQKTIELGNSYKGILLGDSSCGSNETTNEKFFFTKNLQPIAFNYKILKLTDEKLSISLETARNEFLKEIKDNYRVIDLFYSRGLNVIFGK